MLIIITQFILFGILLRAMRPETRKAMEDLFFSRRNLPDAAASCNLTNKEMKIVFNEYCRLNPAIYKSENK